MQFLPLLVGVGINFQGIQEAYIGLQIIRFSDPYGSERADLSENEQNTGVRDFYSLSYFCCGLSGDNRLSVSYFVPLNLSLVFAHISGGRQLSSIIQ